MSRAGSYRSRHAALVALAALFLADPVIAASAAGLSVAQVRERAEAGDVDAQNRLGEWYAGSSELGYNEAEMVKWFARAAQAGHAEAQVSYASLFLYGRGVENDMTQARVWYERAAKQGHHIGQFNTAIAYETGEGAPKDLISACVWYALAARTGTADAAAQKMYERKRDEVRALLPAADRATADTRIQAYQPKPER